MRGDRFRSLRESKNYTHEELAELLQLGTSQIWRYENNKTDPAGDVLARIAKIFGVSTDYLLGLTDDPTPSVDNLTTRERAVLAAMRHGDVVEAIKVMVNDE